MASEVIQGRLSNNVCERRRFAIDHFSKINIELLFARCRLKPFVEKDLTNFATFIFKVFSMYCKTVMIEINVCFSRKM